MNKEYTNISIDPIGFIEGYPIKPCVKSGFCCSKTPCSYGELDEINGGCKYLLARNNLGKRDCGRYEWIVNNVPNYNYYPAFGAGCCMGMFNKDRDEVINNIKKYVLDDNDA